MLLLLVDVADTPVWLVFKSAADFGLPILPRWLSKGSRGLVWFLVGYLFCCVVNPFVCWFCKGSHFGLFLFACASFCFVGTLVACFEMASFVVCSCLVYLGLFYVRWVFNSAIWGASWT